MTSIDVLVNDDDPDGDVATLRITDVVMNGGDGTVTRGLRTVTFSPDPAYVGELSATYTITDVDGLTASARVVLNVLKKPNTPPNANDDTADVVNGGTVAVPIAFNDVDPDADALTYTLVQPPDSGLGRRRSPTGRSRSRRSRA
ncbi:MAG: Ig-like domain-containing protein [Ilumatobacteraceae bacterium]